MSTTSTALKLAAFVLLFGGAIVTVASGIDRTWRLPTASFFGFCLLYLAGDALEGEWGRVAAMVVVTIGYIGIALGTTSDHSAVALGGIAVLAVGALYPITLSLGVHPLARASV